MVLTGCAGQVSGQTGITSVPAGPPAGALDGGRPLTWLGGRELRASGGGFGGLSGLAWADDRLVGVGDHGIHVSLRPDHGPHGRLAGVTGAFAALTGNRSASGLAGRIPYLGTDRGDAEAVTRGPDGGWLVAFEGDHRIVRYDAGFADHSPFPAPPTADLPGNEGLESLARLADGRLLAIAETGAAWVHDGAWHALAYPAGGDFRPTDATVLEDGTVLVLERAYSPVTGPRARVMRVTSPVEAGTTLDKTVLRTLDAPVPLDNYEGLAARPADNGRSILYLVSDDNFNPLQDTYLLTFRYHAP